MIAFSRLQDGIWLINADGSGLRHLFEPAEGEVGKTGVVAVMKNGPGPVLMIRADMDGLPVEERNELPFRSRARGFFNGDSVPVMHACGHDTHVAILMGVAEALAADRANLAGTVKFMFQPAEEGPPGESTAARLWGFDVLGDPTLHFVGPPTLVKMA